MRQLAFASLLVLGGTNLLGCGGGATTLPHSTTPSGEILYVVNNETVSTYSIDPDSLIATPMEEPVSLFAAPASVLQFDPSPHDNFVYAMWSDGQNVQHLSVFQTDSSGVPQIPAFQVLNADSLSQFNMHPSGRFAYMLEVTSSNGLYRADIRLFHAQEGKGILREDPHVQGSYGPGLYVPAFLFGFSPSGRELYDTSTLQSGSVYRQRHIDMKNGYLGSDEELLSVDGEEEVSIGNLIIDQYQSDTSSKQSYLDVFPNTPNPQRPFIHCTKEMLSFCATATNVQPDPSGHYLFLTDPGTRAVHVAAIQLSSGRLTDTGSSIPMTSQIPGFAFSPDGTIVYAMLASDNSVHFYHFDATSGVLIEAGNPLPLAPGSGICPAHRGS
jgi:hypothetical protein